MPRHGYSKQEEQSRKVVYKKRHGDNSATVATAVKHAEGWEAFAQDFTPLGNRGRRDGLGTVGTKADALETLQAWMAEHPAGVAGGHATGGGSSGGLSFQW